jgi:hypothetical protein
MAINFLQSNTEKLKSDIRDQQKEINKENKNNGNVGSPRTKAKNIKFPANTVEEERVFREEAVAAQTIAWKVLLPILLKQFSKIPDARRLKSIKHKITVLMFMGLLMFIFKMQSRRNVNNEMSRPQLIESLRKIFPELDSIPHADTIARFLENIDPRHIESAHIKMIKDLLKNKKFKKLLILGKLPISIDGVQKVVRNGVLHDDNWLERTISTTEGERSQKYVYILEANITFHDGLTIPLMTEFLYFDGNPNQGKQDCELTAVYRFISRIKDKFKRQNIIVCLDKLYANNPVITAIEKVNWKYIIVLPGQKLKSINEALLKLKESRRHISGQERYNGRDQKWTFTDDVISKEGHKITAISCFESWFEVDSETGKKVKKFSEHRWITNVVVTWKNIHEIANLCARKRWGIEDSNNTEKNRGYCYKHLYSKDWNAMCCFHYLMRLGHAVNAISEFTKKLKKLILDFGCSYINQRNLGKPMANKYLV